MARTRLPRERESKLMRSIVVRLRHRFGVVLYRRNVGGRPWVDGSGRRRLVRYGAAGMADLYGWLPARHGARHVEIEVKRPGAVPTPKQLEWLRECHRLGAVAFWVDSATIAERVMGAVLAGYRIAWRDDGSYDLEEG